MVVLVFFIIIITLFTPPTPHIPWTCTRVKDLSRILHVGHNSPLNPAIKRLYIFFFFFFSSWAGVHSLCVCVFLFCLDFLFSSLFLFIITNFFWSLLCFPASALPPSAPCSWDKRKKKKKVAGFFLLLLSSSDWACKGKKKCEML